LFVETWGTAVTSPWVFSIEGSGFQHDYNLAWDLQDDSPSWSGPFASEPHRITTDPLFLNYGGDDFHVRASSPAVNRAGPLTQVTSASGNGTTFTVADAGFFVGDNPALSQYGGNLVVGDTITVGSKQLTIASIDGNNITTTTSFSWDNGDPVALGGDNIPTIGALPYRPEGYVFAVNISSHSDGQSVFGQQTISAFTDPGLVRYVIFFVDGIPVEVDNQSPYTYAWNTTGLPDRSQHTIEARAYSMYASKQPWVGDTVHLTVSTSTGLRPSPPRNLRIRL
jgi:hypothetical protein